MSQRCLACGAIAVVMEGIPGVVDDKWFCTRCTTWGTIAKAKDAPKKDKPVVKRRLEKTHG